LLSSDAVADEGLFAELHEEWLRRMEEALEIEAARALGEHGSKKEPVV